MGVIRWTHFVCNQKSQRDEQYPAPKYFTDEIILRPLPTDKDLILQGLIVNESGQLVCTDRETLQKQQGVLANVAK